MKYFLSKSGILSVVLEEMLIPYLKILMLLMSFPVAMYFFALFASKSTEISVFLMFFSMVIFLYLATKQFRYLYGWYSACFLEFIGSLAISRSPEKTKLEIDLKSIEKIFYAVKNGKIFRVNILLSTGFSYRYDGYLDMEGILEEFCSASGVEPVCNNAIR